MRSRHLFAFPPRQPLPTPRKGHREQAALEQHLRAAHRRILRLQRARRAAARSVGSMAERLAFVCSTTRCSYDDAVWAVSQDAAPPPGRRYEAAIRKAREEGFPIPAAESEARALAQLRRAVRASVLREQQRLARAAKANNSNLPDDDDSNLSIRANSNSPTFVRELVRRAGS